MAEKIGQYYIPGIGIIYTYKSQGRIDTEIFGNFYATKNTLPIARGSSESELEKAISNYIASRRDLMRDSLNKIKKDGLKNLLQNNFIKKINSKIKN